MTRKALYNAFWIILAALLLGAIFEFIIKEIGTRLIYTLDLSTLYTLIGILFSVGISLAVSFTYSDIQNEDLYDNLDSDIKSITYTFTALFFLSTLIFLINQNYKNIDIDSLSRIQLLLLKSSISLLLLVILWMTTMFLNIYKLKSELDNERRNKLKK